MKKREDIYIRDPFVVPVQIEEKYYLFGTTDRNCWNDEKATGFDFYTSKDLENFQGPYPAFRPDQDFWADRNFWAPEVHYYNGRYYMFATFIADDRKRGTQILSAEKIGGPYTPHSNGVVTPSNWMCLDGTLYVDNNEEPWLVFCHEWVEVYDGEICAMKLSPDLKTGIGNPVKLFKASDATWTKSIRVVDNKECFVTDGPFMYRSRNNKLIMIWSSFVENNTYAIGTAYSRSEDILGPWVLEDKPLYSKDAGHGMIFKTFSDKLFLTIHTPNKRGLERPIFIEIEEKDDSLYLF